MAKETMKKNGSKKSSTSRSGSARKGSSERTSARHSGSSRKRDKKKKNKRVLIFAVEILILIALLVGFYVVRMLDKIQKPKVEQENIVVNENIKEETVQTMSGYTTVALFGLDTRNAGQLGKGNRSDTIIIAAINNDTKEVKLVSVYRDTYLNLTNGKYNKCNGAYNAGGPEQAINMLNVNLDLQIEKYVSVDFAALTEVIDDIGGIMIDVDEEELEHLNNYTVETSEVTGVKTQKLTSTGYQLLDGVQATSYCRIRYTAGDDFKRTERQREVIMAIVEKAKSMDLTTINDVINDVFPMIATNYSNDELLQMAPTMIGYDIVDTQGFPQDRTTASIASKGSCVIPVDFVSNVTQLHEYLYDDYNYTPSKEVEEIAAKITADTGY